MPEFILDETGEVAGTAFDDLAPFTQGYIKCLFFTDTSSIAMVDFWNEESQDRIREGEADGELPQDASFSDLSPDALHSIHTDCSNFVAKARHLLSQACTRSAPPHKGTLSISHDGYDYDMERAGHDFWLTRNGHGAGFWDRTELEAGDIGDKLSEIAREFGSCDPYFYQDEESPTGYGFVGL